MILFNDWIAYLSVCLPPWLPAQALTNDCWPITGVFRSKASKLVTCFVSVALEGGLKGGAGLFPLDTFTI